MYLTALNSWWCLTYEIVSFSRSELWSVGHGAELYDAERRLALVMRLTTVDDEKWLQVSLVGVVENAVLVVVGRHLNSTGQRAVLGVVDAVSVARVVVLLGHTQIILITTTKCLKRASSN